MAGISLPGSSSSVHNTGARADVDTEAILEAKRAKRRVPPEKRKRAAQSCARCKDKRVRCVRDEGALVCNACIKVNADCFVCAGAGSKRERYSQQNGGNPSASSPTAAQQQQQQQQQQQHRQQQQHQHQDIQINLPDARNLRETANRGGEDAQPQALDCGHFDPPPQQAHSHQSVQGFPRTAASHPHLVDSGIQQPNDDSYSRKFALFQDGRTADGLANKQPEPQESGLHITPLRSGNLGFLGGKSDGMQYQDSVVQEKSPDKWSGTAVSGQPGASTISHTFTPSQESHEHNDVTGQSHYTGPSASLTLVAYLRALIRQYDADAPFVRETLVHALGSEQTASALQTGGWIPQASTLWPLIETFFRLVHPSFPVLRQTTVWQKVEDIPATNDLSDNWQFVFAVIIALSLSAQSSTDFSTQGTASAVAQLILGRVTCSTSFLGLQGLLLYAYYLHNHNQRDAAWNVMGSAVRMATALGMHRHSSNWSNLSISERETRKLAFWTMYGFERYLCATLGRPSALQDVDILTDMPLDWAVETLSHMPVGYVNHASALDGIMGKISQRIYEGQAEHASDHVVQLLSDLDRWKTDLPNHFDIDSPMPPQHKQATLALHARYYALRVYTTRRALVHYMQENNSPGTLSADEIQRTVRLSRVCVDAAVECTNVLRRLSHADPACGRTSLVLYFAYTSVLIFAVPLACELVLRRRNREPSNTQRMTDISPGHGILVSCLRDCLSMLDPSKDLLPTIATLGQVARDICAAIQIESQQATAQAAPQPRTSQALGGNEAAAAGNTTCPPAAPGAATGGAVSESYSVAPFAPVATHELHPTIPGHGQQYDQHHQDYLQQLGEQQPLLYSVEGPALTLDGTAAPFQTSLGVPSYPQRNVDGHLQFGFDFGIDPSILDTGQPALPCAQQWDDLLQWLQGPGRI